MRSLFKKLKFLLTQHQKKNALVLLIAMFIGAIFEAVGIGLIMPFITMLQNPHLIHEKRILHFLELLPASSDQSILIGAAFLLLAVFVLKNVYLAGLYFFQFRLVASMQISLTRRLFRTYLFAPYTFHLQKNSATLLNNIYSEINMLFFNVLVPSLLILSESLVVLVLVALLVLIDPLTSLASLGLIGGFSALFYYGVRKKMRHLGKERQVYQEQMIKWIHQGLGSIKETKILGRESFFVDTFTRNMSSFANASRFLQTFNNLPRLFIELLAITSLLLIVILTLIQGHAIQSLTPKLALFGMAAFRMMPSMNRIAGMATQILYHRSSIDVVYKDLKHLERDPEKTQSTAIHFQQSIEFQDISYQYPETSLLVLKNVSLTIPKNSVVGLIGPSGAGKTTLVDLLLGLLPPSEGKMLVDGQDIHGPLLTHWQRNIGYVPQNIYLIDDSVRRNVAFGLPDDQIDDERVWDALRESHLEQVVKNLPEGLDAFVGERGVRLSGGERQRLGIARALYHKPELLIMDEATSSLDHETEEQVVRAIEGLRGNKTMIVIAHRLSTVRSCNRIYRLIEGQLTGEVAYEDLVNNQLEVFSRGKSGAL